ncbi:hypothetical protein D1820_13330 [Phaeobacter sp. LSS9]|nr:hypothetical protein D1820_13330 [Phaeobacter sp. LSS9]
MQRNFTRTLLPDDARQPNADIRTRPATPSLQTRRIPARHSRERTFRLAQLARTMLYPARRLEMRRKRTSQSLSICHLDNGHMLHERWREQTFAASAATNHHRTDVMLTKHAFAAIAPMNGIGQKKG